MQSLPNIDTNINKEIAEGNELLIKGNFQYARIKFANLHATHPNDFRVNLGLARCHHLEYRSTSFSDPWCCQMAEKYYSKAIELSEQRDAFIFASYGLFCLDTDQLEKAEYYLFWALHSVPGNYGMSLGLGITYLRRHQYYYALAVFSIMAQAAHILTKEDRCDLYVNLGATYFALSEILALQPLKLKYLNIAKSYTGTAVAFNPQNADANLHYGIILKTCGFFCKTRDDLTNAKVYLAKAADSGTSYPCLANAGLAEVFLEGKDTNEASHRLEIAKKMTPENQRVANYLSQLEELMQSSQQSSVPSNPSC